jgi:hypothetical protein
MRIAQVKSVMKQLTKTIVVISMASLFAMASTADAKGRKGKRAKAAATQVEEDIPWYERDLVPATPVVTPVKKKTAKKAAKKPAPSLDRIGDHQRRRTVAPIGACGAGCDKSARKISMTKLELVADTKDPNAKAARAAKRSRAIKAAKAAKARAARAAKARAAKAKVASK